MTPVGAVASGVPERLGRVGVLTRGLARVPRLRELLGADEVVFAPEEAAARRLDFVVGWGRKPSAAVAERFAARHGVPLLRVEDGFLRSVGLGHRSPPLSLLVDDLGIYYDASQRSRLEALLEDSAVGVLAPLLPRARRLRERIVAARLSKYNHTPSSLPETLRELGDGLIVVADQTYGDRSVELGASGPERFREMLEAALDEHPGRRVVVKVHPDVIAGTKRGYLTLPSRCDRLTVTSEAVNPYLLLERSEHLYVATSQLGFEGLLLGKRVTCFGVPFYAGYGLTDDRVTVPRARDRRGLDEIVAAALLRYARYLHPLRGERCEVETVVEHLALQREMFARNARTFVCLGFSRWKRPFVRRYLESPGRAPRFFGSVAAAGRGLTPAADLTFLVWGPKERPGVAELAASWGAPLWRMEDGFLRSVRLGSDLSAPGSQVVDPRGIYYDPRQESELEHLLAHAKFTEAELALARALRAAIVDRGVSKYNADAGGSLVLRGEAAQRVVLIPGQVEDDASVRCGSPVVRDNSALVREVRAARPDAYLVYKPHPDVVSGNRQGALTPEAVELCDQIVIGAPISACLAHADEVHTMTSLVGFEALLRGLLVVVHGLPFYAGWGLTEDRLPHPRRGRSRTLEELVAAALLRYPRYYSFSAGGFCSALDKVEELSQARNGGWPAWVRRAPRPLRRALGWWALWAEIRHAR